MARWHRCGLDPQVADPMIHCHMGLMDGFGDVMVSSIYPAWAVGDQDARAGIPSSHPRDPYAKTWRQYYAHGIVDAHEHVGGRGVPALGYSASCAFGHIAPVHQFQMKWPSSLQLARRENGLLFCINNATLRRGRSQGRQGDEGRSWGAQLGVGTGY